uniref:Zonular occludens toxin n=1 Tax=Elaeophora elaphi TaxID=1147741 RepID=A0A0R3RP51_9BILA
MRLRFAGTNERHNSSIDTNSQFTLFVLGAPKVGKTALVSQFLWEEFVKEYRPTVEEFNWIEYKKDDGGKTLLQVKKNSFYQISIDGLGKI